MSKKLLIQENEQDILDILCIALEIEGFETLAVLGYNADFIALIRDFHPHLVMLDYRLDGRECMLVARTIRKRFPQLPLVAASCNPSIANLYRQNGFDGYLAKPFDLDHLYNLLCNLISNSNTYEPTGLLG